MISQIYDFKLSRMNFILIMVMFCAGAGTLFMDFLQAAYFEASLRHPKRTVTTASNFESLWDINGVVSIPPKKDVFNGTTRIFPYQSDSGDVKVAFNINGALRNFDLVSGNELWAVESRALLLAHNSKMAFTFSPNRNTMRLSAFNLETGEQDWIKTIDQLAFIDWAYASESVLSFTGQGLKALSPTQMSISIHNGKETPFIDLRPFSSISYSWRKDPTLSKLWAENVAVGTFVEDFVFVLKSSDSSVLAFNRSTGEMLGSITFDHIPVSYGQGDPDFDMQYLNGYLIVYFGDSKQLFAFEFTLP